jgi:hypothetical protein
MGEITDRKGRDSPYLLSELLFCDSVFSDKLMNGGAFAEE